MGEASAIMQAWAVASAGGAEALERVHLPVPQPGRSEILIRVEACGLNFVDLLMMAGRYQVPTAYPHVPGLEVCGIVAKIGDSVSGLRVGDRVIARCDSGGAAECVVTEAERCVPVSGRVPAATAAAFLVNYGTADHFLRRHGGLGQRSSVLVLGAAGAVGSAAVQIAVAAGAEAYGVVSTRGQRDHVISCGAKDCLVHDRSADAAVALKQFLGARRPDIVLDPVGGAFSEAALRVIAVGGRHLVVGFAAGIPHVPLNLALIRRCAIIGDSYRAFCAESPHEAREAAEALVRKVADGTLMPHVPHVLPFAEAQRAFARLAERGTIGRVVLLMPRTG